ncbi:MAG: hypothetical protein KJI69_05210 [Patescibacteria group bacterium]|nr:hypothetical protein [Patescibacteria group bacterium]
MKKTKQLLHKIWLVILCGIPKKQGNYSVYWGDVDGENLIFEIGAFRSIIVDMLDKKGQWASHPLQKLFDKYDKK